MAVAPDRLKSVAANEVQFFQFERFGGQRLVRAFVEIAHDIAFAHAAGTRTLPAQFFNGNVAFPAIVPFDGQFGANLLEIDRSHIILLGQLAAVINPATQALVGAEGVLEALAGGFKVSLGAGRDLLVGLHLLRIIVGGKLVH